MCILRSSGFLEPQLRREDEWVSSPREARGAAGWGDQSEVVPLGSQLRPPLGALVQALSPGGAASAHHDPPEPHKEQSGVGRGGRQKRAPRALPQPPHVADPSPCRRTHHFFDLEVNSLRI